MDISDSDRLGKREVLLESLLPAGEALGLRLTDVARQMRQGFYGEEAQRLQRVTSNVNLQLTARGQLANDALLASEEFGVGGINSGRGYDPSEIVGDDGISGSVEVQWNEPYPVSYLEDYQLFGFYDIGKVWNTDVATGADEPGGV